MHEIAEKRGGKCLSTKYKDVKTKLLWECEYGHRWETTPANIRKGRWCPKCGYKIAGKKISKTRRSKYTKYNRNYKQFPHKHKF